MAKGKILSRWFHRPKNIFRAIETQYEVDGLYDVNDSLTQIVLQRNGVTIRVRTTNNDETLLDTTDIDVYALDPSKKLETAEEQKEWETELGDRFHTELLELMEAPTTAVFCNTCDYNFVAFNREEGMIAGRYHESSQEETHVVLVDGELIEDLQDEEDVVLA